jgi:hypothetical protein
MVYRTKLKKELKTENLRKNRKEAGNTILTACRFGLGGYPYNRIKVRGRTGPLLIKRKKKGKYYSGNLLPDFLYLY